MDNTLSQDSAKNTLEPLSYLLKIVTALMFVVAIVIGVMAVGLLILSLAANTEINYFFIIREVVTAILYFVFIFFIYRRKKSGFWGTAILSFLNIVVPLFVQLLIFTEPLTISAFVEMAFYITIIIILFIKYKEFTN